MVLLDIFSKSTSSLLSVVTPPIPPFLRGGGAPSLPLLGAYADLAAILVGVRNRYQVQRDADGDLRTAAACVMCVCEGG